MAYPPGGRPIHPPSWLGECPVCRPGSGNARDDARDTQARLRRAVIVPLLPVVQGRSGPPRKSYLPRKTTIGHTTFSFRANDSYACVASTRHQPRGGPPRWCFPAALRACLPATTAGVRAEECCLAMRPSPSRSSAGGNVSLQVVPATARGVRRCVAPFREVPNGF